MPTDDKSISPRRDWCAVLVALVVPTLVTVVYFVLLAKSSTTAQQVAYAVGKTLQFGGPALWIAWMQPARLGWTRPRGADVVWGIGLGLALLAAILGLYQFGAKPAGLIPPTAVVAVREKVLGLGVGSVPVFLIMAGFYSLIHSLLEEYYWRWFVFGQLRQLTSLPWAIGISSLGFMAHHVCIVSVYFGWFSLESIVLSLAVAGGGAIWAWLYQRNNSLIAPWISHALVDAAIFIVGYDLVM